MAGARIIAPMTSPEAAATRTLALELPEKDWEALRAVEPDAVGWLRAMIRSRLSDRPTPELQTAEFDDY
jgi:hypothetical protein